MDWEELLKDAVYKDPSEADFLLASLGYEPEEAPIGFGGVTFDKPANDNGS